MILGFGTDICENKRIRHLHEKFGDRFLKKIYTKKELAYCMSRRDPIPHLTARFALKEAFIKSLNIENSRNLSYRQVSLMGNKGKKVIHVSGKLNEVLTQMDTEQIWFSISHAENYSTATVLLEKT